MKFLFLLLLISVGWQNSQSQVVNHLKVNQFNGTMRTVPHRDTARNVYARQVSINVKGPVVLSAFGAYSLYKGHKILLKTESKVIAKNLSETFLDIPLIKPNKARPYIYKAKIWAKQPAVKYFTLGVTVVEGIYAFTEWNNGSNPKSQERVNRGKP